MGRRRERGSKRGYAFLPLYKKVPQAALKDDELYQLLALVDALRDGGARERELAERELSGSLSGISRCPCADLSVLAMCRTS